MGQGQKSKKRLKVKDLAPRDKTAKDLKGGVVGPCARKKLNN